MRRVVETSAALLLVSDSASSAAVTKRELSVRVNPKPTVFTMCRYPFSLTPLIALTTVLAVVVTAQAGEPELLDLTQARPAWEKALTMAQSINGTARYKTVYSLRPGPNTPDSEAVLEVKQNNNCVVLLTSGSELRRIKNADYVMGMNSKYSFQLKRTTGNSEWAIDQVDLDSDGSKLMFSSEKSLRKRATRSVCPYFLMSQDSLEQLFEKPNFRVTKTERVVVDGANMVRIEFDYPNPVEKASEPGFNSMQGGYFILDPQHLWCLKEFRVRTDDSLSKRIYSGNNVYVAGPDQFPILRESQLDDIGFHPDGTDWFNCNCHIQYDFQYAPKSYQDHEMTLSAFGLPEPYGITWEKPTPRYLWLFAAAGVFAIAAIGFQKLAKRPRPVPANTLQGQVQ